MNLENNYGSAAASTFDYGTTTGNSANTPGLIQVHFENKMAGKLPLSDFDDTFNEKLSREAALFDGLLPASLEEAAKYVVEDPGKLVEGAVAAITLGLAIGSAVKNPGILGKNAAPIVKGVLEWSPKVFGTLAAVDVTTRVAVPMFNTWNDADSLPEMKTELARNVGTGIVDYSVATAGGIAGGVLGFKATPEWINKPPAFDSQPSLKLGRGPTKVENESAYTTKQEKTLEDDVVALYEKSFPKEELQPVDEVKELMASDRIVVHTTRNEEGLQAFTFSSRHDETPFKFFNLDFIATEPGLQSKGIGSLHARRLNEQLKAENPGYTGMTLEMEAVAEAGLEPAILAQRIKRSEFYDRQDAGDTNVVFKIFDFNDRSYRGDAEWRAWVWDAEKFDAVKAARLMITDEGGYGLPLKGREIREFDKANNYYEPTAGPITTGLMVSPAVVAPHRLFDGRTANKGQPIQ